MKVPKLVNWLVSVMSLLFLLSAAHADVPPEPGYKRVQVDLVLTSAENYPEYRFFVKSGAALMEIVLKTGEKVTIQPLGGGAWYRTGTLIAVPKSSLAGLSESAPETGTLNDMKQAVYDGTAAGAIELVKHSFIHTVRESATAGPERQEYSIDKDAEKGLKAVLVGGSDTRVDTGSAGLYSTEPRSGLFWGTVAAGSLMTMAFIGLGVWFIRRSRARGIR